MTEYYSGLKQADPEELLEAYLDTQSGMINVKDALPCFHYDETLARLTNLTQLAVEVAILKNSNEKGAKTMTQTATNKKGALEPATEGQKELAELISRVMNHPECPDSLYNAIGEELNNMFNNAPFREDAPEYIAQILAAHRQAEDVLDDRVIS